MTKKATRETVKKVIAVSDIGAKCRIHDEERM